jgi:undecaprenyl-diphosphatase
MWSSFSSGPVAAVALLYWRQVVSMLRGALGQDAAGRRLLIQVIVAFVPAAAIGFLAHDWIDAHLFSIPTVIAAQLAAPFSCWRSSAGIGAARPKASPRPSSPRAEPLASAVSNAPH